MSDTPKPDAPKPANPAAKAGEMMKTGMQTAAATAKEVGRTTAEMSRSAMEKGLSGMESATASAAELGRSAMERGMAGMAEFQRMFADMKMPAMGNMDTVMQAQRRNMEAMSAAYKVSLEGAQAVGKRNMEIMQQTMAEMTEAMRDLASPESPQARAAKQAELLKVAYERAVAHMKELSDLIQRSNGEALAMLNSRFTEAMEEVKQLAAKAGTPGA